MMQPDVNIPAEEFNGMITELKKASVGTSNLTKDDLKKMASKVASSLYRSVENLIDCLDGENEDFSNQNQLSPRASIQSMGSVTQENALDQLQEPAKEISHSACDIEEPIAQVQGLSQRRPAVQRALDALVRIASQLQGFYQWLKEKARQIATDLWQKVRRAFSTMLTWLRSIGSEIRSACGAPFKIGAKVHVA